MNSTSRLGNGEDRLVSIGADGATLEGNLGLVPNARGVVLFAHGSGSSRHSARNRYVAEVLRQGGLATLLLDLLTKAEEEIDLRARSTISSHSFWVSVCSSTEAGLDE
jgi:putative phosphoribosyl transferase